MAQDWKLTRRIMGMLSTRVCEVPLASVPDHRDARGKRWSLPVQLRAMLLGLMGGCKNLAETETLTGDLSPVVRTRTGIHRRVPDTTMRNTAVDVEPNEICKLIRHSAQAAGRRHALESDF